MHVCPIWLKIERSAVQFALSVICRNVQVLIPCCLCLPGSTGYLVDQTGGFECFTLPGEMRLLACVPIPGKVMVNWIGMQITDLKHCKVVFFYSSMSHHLKNRVRTVQISHDGRRHLWDSSLRPSTCESPAQPLCNTNNVCIYSCSICYGFSCYSHEQI